MPQPKERKRYPFDKPGTYRIRFIGHLNDSWSDRLGGMRIEESSRGDQGSNTTLVGQIHDQAKREVGSRTRRRPKQTGLWRGKHAE